MALTAKITREPAQAVWLAGCELRGGGGLLTMTRCEQVAVLPLRSVAVQVTRLVPTGNCAGALLVTLDTPQLSAAPGPLRLTPVARHELVSVATVTSAGGR